MSELHTNQDRLERLRALTEVSRALTYTTSTEEVLRLTVDRATELVGADRALLMLTDDDGMLTVRAARGIEPERWNDIQGPLEETLIRRLQDLLDYPDEASFLSVPLVAQGNVTGLLAAVRAAGGAAREDDEWLLSALADQAAVALENARLTQAARQERGEWTRAMEVQGRAHATLGHELRSPLTAIQSYSSLLLDGLLGPITDRQREGIARIRMSGQHLLAVIENLLDMARLDADAITISTAPTPLHHVIDEAAQMLEPVAAKRQQELRTTCPHDLVVEADADRLRQALVNLIGNAIKYTPDEGTIQVDASARTREGDSFAAIAVTDNGRGIPPHVLDTIFEPYDRGAAADTEGGLGLGLFISRELIRQMGGTIDVHSEPGTGTTFNVFVPMADAPATD